MGIIRITIVFIIILFTSCKNQDRKIDIEDWKVNSKNSFEKEIHKLNNKVNEDVALSRVYGLLNSREKFLMPLDSIINFKKQNEIEVLENYLIGVTISYTVKYKLGNVVYTFRSSGENISQKKSDYKVELFDDDISSICNDEPYNDTFELRRIAIYSNLKLSNGVYKSVKICSNLNPDGSDL